MAALQYKDDHNRIAYLGGTRVPRTSQDISAIWITLIKGTLYNMTLRSCLTHWSNNLVRQLQFAPYAAGSHDLVALLTDREVVGTEGSLGISYNLMLPNGIFEIAK
ncbi:hypothetical protein Tco_0494222 [Tanacetum coccineum]